MSGVDQTSIPLEDPNLRHLVQDVSLKVILPLYYVGEKK